MNSSGSDGAGAAAAAGLGIFVLIYFLVIASILAFTTWMYWRIAVKAGYPGWYSLLLLVPCLNVVLPIMFAFTEWPIEKELAMLRASGGYTPGTYPRPGGQAPPPSTPPFDPI